MNIVLTERRLDDVVSRRAAARLRAFRRSVERALPGEVTHVVLFGSRARGDARRDSDYDVAVFVRHLDDRRSVSHALADLAYPHIVEGYHINPVVVPEDFLDRPGPGTLRYAIGRDGVAVL